jgi:DNA-binding transcriptional ArsR family regulator
MTTHQPAHTDKTELPAESRLKWEFGTAYDFFISLHVLHEPEKFGLRASWAAGVRSRLPAAERKFLEEINTFFWVPLHWIITLPEPKDAETVLFTLRQIPPSERLAALTFSKELPGEVKDMLLNIQSRRAWEAADLETLRLIEKGKGEQLSTKTAQAMLDWWAKAEEFGEKILPALQAYYQSFFSEEEKRILPALRTALDNAQALSQQLSIRQLITELTQGLEFEEKFYTQEIILGPAYWSTPLVFFADLAPQKMLLLFGARPPEASLVPGEQVPDSLLMALKALADPTRLRILRYLEQEAHTPAQLARKLRLRAPTVTHHLNELRLAGLVQITLTGEGRQYSPRKDYLAHVCEMFEQFLQTKFGEADQ